MNYIDIIILVLLLFAAINGFRKGFIIEVASLIGLILGVWGAIKFSGFTADFIINKLKFENSYIDEISFVATFVLIIIGVHILAKIIEKMIETVALGPANRILGLFFGVFKAAFIISIIVIMIDRIDETLDFIPEQKVKESKLYNPMKNISLSALPFLQGIFEDFKGEKEEDEKDDSGKDTKTS